MQLFRIIFWLIFVTSTFQAVDAVERGCPAQETILPCRCLIRRKEYQIWCSHSNLSSILDSLKAIALYITSPIDELILENNYLPSLPGRTFSLLKILRLMLRHNSLERVSTDWLANLESSLLELYIVEPKLSSLPQMSLARMKNLKAITIRSKLLKRLPLISGLPLLKYIQIESNALTDIPALNFKDNPALEKFHLQSSPRLTRLEANLFDDLPNLDIINITNTGLNWVHPRAFSRLPRLKELSLTGNKFTDPGMIGRSSRELSNLEIIRLDYNYINVLEEASFVDMKSLKSIYLSNNLIDELRKGAFHKLPALRSIDLSNNVLRRIQRQSFYQPSFVEELNLRYNELSEISQLRSVLEDLPKLVYLDVSFNKLDTIPFGSLMGHTTLEQFNLGYNRLRLVDKEAFIGMPALRDLVLTNNSLTDGNRLPYWNLPALKSLELSKNYLSKLDPRFLTNIESLRRVDLSKNGLNFVDPEAFLSTPLLEHINVSNNYLKNLHPVTFRHLAQLYELDASRNNLKMLVSGLPKNIEHLHLRENEILKLSFEDLQLPALRLLDLSENRIQTLGDGQLKGMGRLKKLYIRSNFLRKLGEKSLEGLIQLEILDLGDNRISEIHPLALQSVSEIKIFDIANNQLSFIGPSLLSNAKRLIKLNASHNQLGEILGNSFQATLNLQDLDLSSNLLVQFPQTLFGLEKLKKLDLSSNRLKTINSTIISSFKNLREIKLSKNFIQILEKNSFGNMKHLKTVYLDENDVMLIEPNFMKMLPALKLIKLQRNKIEQLPSHTFNTLLSLQNVELQENYLNLIHNQAFHLVPQLLTLNLSHNEIMSIEKVGLQSLRSLELLDLSFNKITKMSMSLNQLEWLVELRLDNNHICEVDEDVFGNMPRLKVLDLRNNRLISFPEVAVERLRENTAQLDVEDNPLACTCDILWLKSWLRESSQKSPRCADGTLLKEMPLSIDECPLDKQKEKQFSGCDTELLNAPGFGNLELYSKYASLRNFSAIPINGKNQLAPSPEESEYFYDDYIDYPFNESAIVSSDYINDKPKNKLSPSAGGAALEDKQQNVTGNTPVLYAAPSKTKPKPDIPAKVPDSPSTSGFTFFGIPLPALKNIFGKKEDGTALPQQATRKTAIVNNPRKEKKHPMPKVEAALPHQTIIPKYSHNLPVSRPTPELQGGFVPILPGAGGFKPIPDPRLTSTSTISSITDKQKLEEATKQQPEVKVKELRPTVSDNFSLQSPNADDVKLEPYSRPKKNYNLELTTNTSSLTISADATSVSNNEKKKDQIVEGNMNITSLETMANVRVFNKSQTHTFIKPHQSDQIQPTAVVNLQSTTLSTTAEVTPPPEPPSTTTTTKTEQTSTFNNLPTVTINVPEKQLLLSVSEELENKLNISEEYQPGITVLSEEDVKEPELSGMETQIKETEEKSPERKLSEQETVNNHTTGSLLSTLLVPGGQQPLFKPTSRSTITKVASPHKSGARESALHSSIEVAEPRIANTYLKSNPPLSEEIIITSTEENSNIKSDWYFENYNKKNLEPFVSKKIENKHSNGNKLNGPSLILLIALFFVFR